MPAKKQMNLDHLIKSPKTEVNQIIKEKLNAVIEDTKIMDLAGKAMWEQTQALRFIKGLSELTALRLNLPTKDDVANVARLTIQVEEKIDTLEEKLSILIDKLQELRETENDNSEEDIGNISAEMTEQENPRSSHLENKSDKREQKRLSHTDLLKQLQNDLIFNSITLHAQDLPDLNEYIKKTRKAEKK